MARPIRVRDAVRAFGTNPHPAHPSRRRTPGRSRRIGVAALAALLLPALPSPPAQADDERPALRVTGERTQPVFSRADAVDQRVDVETETDSDGDGKRDTVRVRILRPKETDAGLKVATIIEASPYWGGGNDVPFHPVDVEDDGLPGGKGRDGLPGLFDGSAGTVGSAGSVSTSSVIFPGYTDNYFLPRGYAVAHVDSIGTGGSTGCPTSGSREETLGAKAAIDWLNGRARAWNAEDGRPATADWSTGNAAMMGISYNGTLPTAVAATGVEGLKAIVPIAGISSWYDYYRANGGVVAPGGFQGEDADVLAKAVYSRADREICVPLLDRLTAEQDRTTGDYTRFWRDRDYLPDVRRIKAGVFLVHGLNDWNVKTRHAAQLWEALRKHHVPRKLWLHQAGHSNPMPLRMEEWLTQLHQWYDFWLYGLDNGALDGPRVDVEQADFSWQRQTDWPRPGTRDLTLRLNADGGLSPLPGRPVLQTLHDAGRTLRAEQLVTGPDAPHPNRLAYTTGPLPRDLRINGTPEVSLRASLEGTSPYTSALLVDYGTDTRATAGTVADTSRLVCYGEGVPGDTGCAYRTRHRTETADFRIVTRGWLDARNRDSVARQSPLVEGREYRLRWAMQPQDYVIRKGHRLGVVLISTDHDFTLRHPAGTRMSVRAGLSSVTLPVAPVGP
ncbi:Xaa-Pro dipeptidyl-peptidase [Streptomyces sp. NPDC006368]|uniref:Xaa-Pro dipeptidyl-peptidase n=1 Tax=Streptomyces sp. NPDC006368 TaxID=3156760 RepID=UPI0033B6B414